MKKLISIFFGVILFASFQTVPVAGKIMQFCKSNMGKQIDRGECWDLASAALTAAGADWSPSFNFGDKINYKKDQLKPADVLQFFNAKIVFKNGSVTLPKHTAIVAKANGNKVLVYHQNFNSKRYVDTLTLDLDNLKKGTIDAYRPKGKQAPM